jgi:hypothetical protein
VNPAGTIDLVFIFSGNAQMCGHGSPRQGNSDIRVLMAPGENVEGWTANAMLPETLAENEDLFDPAGEPKYQAGYLKR